MDQPANDAHHCQLAQICNRSLRRLAEEDPTLTRLKAALEEEQRWQAMTKERLACMEQLEAKYHDMGDNPLGHP